MPCCSAAVASSSNDGTADSADESRCATAADPGGCAHSDKNRNAPSDSVAIDRDSGFSDYHVIVTDTGAAVDPLLMHDTSRAGRSERRAAPAAAAIDVTETPTAAAAAAAAEVAPAPAPAASNEGSACAMPPTPPVTRYAGGAIGATGVAPGAPAAASGLGPTATTPTAHEAPRFHQPRP